METYQMSQYQKNIWNLELFYPGTGIGNIGGLVVHNQKYSYKTVKQSCETMIALHSSVRLQINRDHLLYEKKPESIEMERVDLSHMTEEEFKHTMEEWMAIPFSLYDAPLYSFCYIDRGEHTVIFEKYHHLIADGAAIVNSLLCQEKAVAGIEQEEFVDTYLDYLKEQVKPSEKWKKKADEYFKKIQDDVAECSMTEEKASSLSASRKHYNIPLPIQTAIREFTQMYDYSFEVLFYSAFSVYLSKRRETEYAVLGRTLVNRTKKEMHLMGMFVNTLPICIRIEQEEAFLDLCKKVKNEFYNLNRYSSYDIHEFSKKNHIDRSLFDISFSYRNKKLLPVSKNCYGEEFFNGFSELPLKVFLNDSEDQVSIEMQYQKDCFQEIEIDVYVERCLNILFQGMKNLRIREMTICCKLDLKYWERLNATKTIAVEKTVSEYIEEQVTLHPGDVAVRFQTESMTYEELQKVTSRIAFYLEERQVKPGDFVGLNIERSLWLPAAITAVLKMGAAFVPIDRRDSKERYRSIASLCSYVLNQEEVEDLCSLKKENKQYPLKVSESGIAYVLHTSGSTGEPKAAMISNRSLIIRLLWMADQYGCEDNVLQKTTYTFDVSVWEFLLPLICGKTVCLLEPGGERSPEYILKALSEYRIGMVHFVPTMFRAFLDYYRAHPTSLESLRHIFSSGEVLEGVIAQDFHELFPNSKLHNLYGPTECTVDVTFYDCQKGDKVIPIGRPVWNTQLYILNKQNEVVPVGVRGELCIVGDLVGEGYYGIESDKFSEFQGKKAYYTGDTARLGFDGMIYYEGRSDRQVKINGIRIDLDAIEDSLCSIPAIRQGAVIQKNTRLLAFYTAENEMSELKEILRKKLPYHSIPSSFFFLKEFPVKPNGKLDHQSFLEYEPEEQITERPAGRREKYLHKVVCELLQCKQVSVTEDLLVLGLDSFMILDFVARLEEKKWKLSIQDIYEERTIRKIAEKKTSRRKVWYYKQEKQKKLYLYLPYASGEPQSILPVYRRLEQNEVDMAGINMSFFKSQSIYQIADQLMKVLAGYDEVTLLGYCIGSALALELAKRFQEQGTRISQLILLAALPLDEFKVMKGKVLPWDLMNNKQMKIVLQKLMNRNVRLCDRQLNQFRLDVKKAFDYFVQEKKEQKKLKNLSVQMVFIHNDPFTFRYKHRYKDWGNYISGKVQVHIFSGKSHYFIKQYKEEIVELIVKGEKRFI